MAESFNLNTFKQEYPTYNKQYRAEDFAKNEMEQVDIAKAEVAIQNEGLLSLTLGSKLGVGDRVVQQITDTAANIVKGVVSPLTEYLNKYEKVFDQEAFTQEFQEMAKQMYYSKEALSTQASKGIYINGLSEEGTKTATKFIWNM